MSPIETAGLTIFIVFLLIGFFSILFGLPGTLIILADTIIYAAITGFERIGIKIIITLVALSVIAESLEFFLGISWPRRYGASRKGVTAAFIGGILGAIMMTPVLLGLGAIIGSFAGALAGAFIVEIVEQQDLRPAVRAGFGAFVGRLAGLSAKGLCALTMVIIVLMNIYS